MESTVARATEYLHDFLPRTEALWIGLAQLTFGMTCAMAAVCLPLQVCPPDSRAISGGLCITAKRKIVDAEAQMSLSLAAAFIALAVISALFVESAIRTIARSECDAAFKGVREALEGFTVVAGSMGAPFTDPARVSAQTSGAAPSIISPRPVYTMPHFSVGECDEPIKVVAVTPPADAGEKESVKEETPERS